MRLDRTSSALLARPDGGSAPAVALSRLAVLGLLLLAWYAAAARLGPNVVPSPGETWAAALRLLAEGRLQTALGESLAVFGSGYLAAVAVAVPLGMIMGALPLLGRSLELYVYALAATPRVAFIPLIIVILGIGFEAKVFVVFLGAVMPVVINTYAGVRQADSELVEMARSVGAGRLRIFLRVVLPGAVPYVIVGLRLGATIGLINTVVAELYTAVRGLGGLLAIYGNTFRMAEYFVVVLCLAAIGVAVTEALRHLEARFARWRSA